MPKHKGNEKLRGQIKRKIATLKAELEASKRIHRGAGGTGIFIEREGAAQIVLIGPTKAGRSSLLAAVTNAKPVIGIHHYTTRDPIPGMMMFEDIQFQLVEAPAIIPGTSKETAWNARTLALARNADALIIMVDLSRDPQAEFKWILDELRNSNICLQRSVSTVNILSGRGSSGIQIIVTGELIDCTIEDVKRVLKQYDVSNALVRIFGRTKLSDIEDAVLETSMVYKPAVIVANKVDMEGARERLERLKSSLKPDLPLIPVSCTRQEGLSQLGKAIFKSLELVRVYTKEPNRPQRSPNPFVLKKKSTIGDLARQIHTDLYQSFAYAKIWGPSSKYPGEKVGISRHLEDGDTVEIHGR